MEPEILCRTDELDIEHTVICGQAFRWRLDADGRWACVLTAGPERVPILLKLWADQGRAWFQISHPDHKNVARDYFRMDVDLTSLARQFASADTAIAPAIAAFPGLRVLRQDPVECFFSFLCSSASPLHRIRRGIDGLCRTYGEVFPGDPTWRAFPTVERLSEASIEDMMALGLGYRARYIQAAARQVRERGGADWLLSLRGATYLEAKQALMELTGAGEKIADCVCLFSLDKDQAIPVDTHVRQIAYRHYLPAPKTQSLTKAAYAEIGNAFRTRFGPMAGWAQQYLFFDNLYEKRAWSSYESQYLPEKLESIE